MVVKDGWAKRLAGIAMVGAVVVLGACGSSSDDSSESAASTAAAAATTDAATSAPASSEAATSAAADTAASSSADTAASSAAESTGEPLKVALVYNAPVTDQGWNQAFDVARQKLEQTYGDKVAFTWKENVADGAQSGQVMKQLIDEGNTVIVSTSFGYQEEALKLADANPDVTFLQVTALKTAPNLSGFDFNGPEGYYIAGMAAAAAAKDSHLGFIGAFPIPSNLSDINAYTLGAQKIKPDATVSVVWTNDWVDLTKAQNAAQGLVNSGASALAYLTSGPGAAPVAKETNTPWIGFEVDQSARAPDQYVTGVLLDWAPYLQSQIDQIIAGTWQTGYAIGGVKEGVVGPDGWGAAFQAVPAETQQQIEDAVAGLKDGSVSVFAGPITDQNGKVRVADGEVADPAAIQATDYFVEGVDGTIPAAG